MFDVIFPTFAVLAILRPLVAVAAATFVAVATVAAVTAVFVAVAAAVAAVATVVAAVVAAVFIAVAAIVAAVFVAVVAAVATAVLVAVFAAVVSLTDADTDGNKQRQQQNGGDLPPKRTGHSGSGAGGTVEGQD